MVAINRSSLFVTLLFQIFGCRSSSGIRKPWPVDKSEAATNFHNRLTAEDEKQLLWPFGDRGAPRRGRPARILQ
jgi:hypothetical protein